MEDCEAGMVLDQCPWGHPQSMCPEGTEIRSMNQEVTRAQSLQTQFVFWRASKVTFGIGDDQFQRPRRVINAWARRREQQKTATA